MSDKLDLSRRALVVFAKEPTPGKVKTRLAPAVSPADAACLYACFLEDTIERALGISGVSVHVAYHPPGASSYFRRLARGRSLGLISQEGRNLSERMIGVVGGLFASGARHVVAVGSDSPSLPPQILRTAFRFLGLLGRDVVLAPGRDGGYLLIGFSRSVPEVLGVEMSTPGVLAATIEKARGLGLKVGVLPSWYDVDVPGDLERLREDLSRRGAGGRNPPPRTMAFLSAHPAVGAAAASSPA